MPRPAASCGRGTANTVRRKIDHFAQSGNGGAALKADSRTRAESGVFPINPAGDTCTRRQKFKQVNEAQCSPCGIQGPSLQEEREAGARFTAAGAVRVRACSRLIAPNRSGTIHPQAADHSTFSTLNGSSSIRSPSGILRPSETKKPVGEIRRVEPSCKTDSDSQSPVSRFTAISAVVR